jgi:hypothetical protein
MNAARAILILEAASRGKCWTLKISGKDFKEASAIGQLAINAMQYLGCDSIATALPSSAAYKAYQAFFRACEGGTVGEEE